jgi:transcriptional regulator with XRE-family HTH domain
VSSGALLRHWRETRHLSQLALSLEAGVSSRHLSFIETGRAQPSREMIHRLAEVMGVPLRERNALLLSAGFAPAYPQAGIDLTEPGLAPVRSALDAMLAQQEPFPAVVLSRHWDVLKTNAAAGRLFGFLLGPERREEPPNVVRLMFDPRGLRPFVKNWEATAEALIRRVHREAVGAVVDDATGALLEEVLAYPGVPARWRRPDVERPLLPVVPVIFEKDGTAFSYFSAVTTLGTPQDVLLQEVRVEAFFPMDEETRSRAEAWA